MNNFNNTLNYVIMKKNSWLLFIIFILIFIHAGCGDASTDDETNEILLPNCPACSEVDKYAYLEYDYMYKTSTGDSFYSLRGGRLTKIIDAFYDRALVNLNFNTGFNGRVAGTRCSWKLYQSEYWTDLDSVAWQNRQYNTLFYLCCIDHCVSTDDPDRLGYSRVWGGDSTWTIRGSSIVFEGKIEEYPGVPSYETRENAKATVTAHELCHLIGYSSHSDGHEGSYSNCCMASTVLNITANVSCVRDDFHICDQHACYNRCKAQQLILASGHSNLSGNNFQIKNLNSSIFLNKTSYVEGEPIFLTITIKNNAIDIDSISYVDFQEAFNELRVNNSQNKTVFTINDYSTLAKMSYTKIEPNAELSKTIELQEYFGTKTLPQTFYTRSLYFIEGAYTVQYVNKKFPSNNIEFKIEKPIGLESDVFAKLLVLYSMKEADLKSPEGEKFKETLIEAKFNAIKEIMDSYPANLYTEEIYNIYNRMSASIGVKEELIDKNLWFIYNYPNSYYLDNILYTTMHAVYNFRNGETSVNELLTKIINDYPNTAASKIAETLMLTKKYQK